MEKNRPIKKYRSGLIEGAVWLNEKTVNGNIVGFKTVSLRRSWRDKDKDIWRDEKLNLRKGDIPKLICILSKIQEDILLSGGEEGEEND